MGQEINTHDDDGESDGKGTTGGMREGAAAIFPCGRGRIEKGMRFIIVRPHRSERLRILRNHMLSQIAIAKHRLSGWSTPSMQVHLSSLLILALIKFAIRTTIRNHNTLTRDGVIKQVADAVGPSHTVDLKNYDLLILVEIYKVRNLRDSTPKAMEGPN